MYRTKNKKKDHIKLKSWLHLSIIIMLYYHIFTIQITPCLFCNSMYSFCCILWLSSLFLWSLKLLEEISQYRILLSEILQYCHKLYRTYCLTENYLSNIKEQSSIFILQMFRRDMQIRICTTVCLEERYVTAVTLRPVKLIDFLLEFLTLSWPRPSDWGDLLVECPEHSQLQQYYV